MATQPIDDKRACELAKKMKEAIEVGLGIANDMIAEFCNGDEPVQEPGTSHTMK